MTAATADRVADAQAKLEAAQGQLETLLTKADAGAPVQGAKLAAATHDVDISERQLRAAERLEAEDAERRRALLVAELKDELRSLDVTTAERLSAAHVDAVAAIRNLEAVNAERSSECRRIFGELAALNADGLERTHGPSVFALDGRPFTLHDAENLFVSVVKEATPLAVHRIF